MVDIHMTNRPAAAQPAAYRPFKDPEIAREAAYRSAAVRRAKRDSRPPSPEARALELIRSSVDKLTAALLDAALGKGDFVDLKPSERLKALQRALEYGLGRPGGSAKGDDETPELPTSDSLFGPEPPSGG